MADQLSCHAPGEKTVAFPSIPRIGRAIGRCPNVVRLSLENLEFFGYLRPQKRTGCSTRYELLWKVPGFTPADPKGLSPRAAESARIAKTKASNPSVLTKGYPSVLTQWSAANQPLRNHGGEPLRNYGHEASSELKIDVEDLGLSDLGAVNSQGTKENSFPRELWSTLHGPHDPDDPSWSQ